jgi:predicted ABC-type ATPase
MSDEKKILIIAGPNGAGKTTFAQEFLPNEANCPAFVNADLIAAGLSPFAPEVAAVKAGRLMLEQIHEYSRRGISFAFETTLSGRGYARLIPQWRAAGYRVKLIFLQLPNPEMAIARVAARVAQGGHGVPEEVVRRRFFAGQRNFDLIYKPLVDSWILYDNSGEIPLIIEAGGRS